MHQIQTKRHPVATILFLLLLCIFTGCSKKENLTSTSENERNTQNISTNTNVSASSHQISLFSNNKSFSPEDLAIQKEFEDFLATIFQDTYQTTPITIHFLLENPENYGITRVPSAWTYPDVSKTLENIDELKETLEALKAFSYDSLTSEQQYIYKNLSKEIELELSFPDAYLFSSVFSLDGLVSQLPLIFTEYCFRNETDIEEYLLLLEDLNHYVDSCLDFERYRMKEGYALSDYTYDSNIAQCEAFLANGEDYLSDLFLEKLEEYNGLSESKKEEYVNRCKNATISSVLPAYQSICDTLHELKKEGSCNQGLCHLENGTAYYQYLIQAGVGTDKSAKELIALVDENISAYQAELTSLLLKDPSLYDALENPEYIYQDADQILSYLSGEITTDFPFADCGTFRLEEINEAMADQLSVAFYLLSPIDHYKNNVIYTNPERIGAGNDLFPTLAHEGFPGHLYQHNYFWSTNPSYFRALFSVNGYSEGWAEYVECYSYNWSGLSDTLASVLKINTLLSDAIPVRIDLGVNYEGWGMEETAAYLAQFGIEAEDAILSYYETVISAPTVFFSYYIGYLEIIELKEEISSVLGEEFSLMDFHKFILDAGPSYFSCIKALIPEWSSRILK